MRPVPAKGQELEGEVWLCPGQVQGSTDHTHSQTENSWTSCARGWEARPLTWSTRSTLGVGVGGRHSGPLLSLL